MLSKVCAVVFGLSFISFTALADPTPQGLLDQHYCRLQVGPNFQTAFTDNELQYFETFSATEADPIYREKQTLDDYYWAGAKSLCMEAELRMSADETVTASIKIYTNDNATCAATTASSPARPALGQEGSVVVAEQNYLGSLSGLSAVAAYGGYWTKIACFD